MFSYIGGKHGMIKEILAAFPAGYEKMSYVEVFGGAGWIITNKKPSVSDVYNDVNKDLSNLFYVLSIPHLRYRLMRALRYCPNSRVNFKAYRDALKSFSFKIPNLGRAVAFIYVRACSFAGRGSSFGTCRDGRVGGTRVFLTKVIKKKRELSNLNIENLDYKSLIAKYDSPNAFFYLDPPYYGSEDVYNGGKFFTRADHEVLAEILKTVKGKFLVSYYDDTAIRELYKGFHFQEFKKFKASYFKSTGFTKRPATTELLISNYIPPTFAGGGGGYNSLINKNNRAVMVFPCGVEKRAA